MSDNIPNCDTWAYFPVLVTLVALSAIMIWYLWHGREGAVDIWKAAAAIFVIWLIWDSRNADNKSDINQSMSILISKDSMSRILDIESAVIGKQRTYWYDEKIGIWISYLVTFVLS